MPEEVRKKLEAAIELSAKEHREMAQRLVPVDESHIKNSIRRDTRKNRVNELVVTNIAGHPYADTGEYVAIIEFTKRPFWFPSWRAIRKRVRRRIAKAMREAIKAAIQ